MAFFLRYKKLHIWLLADLVLLAAFFLTRGNRTLMNKVADRVTNPLRRNIENLCYRVHFSVMELLCVVLVIFAVVYVLWSIFAIVRAKKYRRRRIYSAVLGAVCVVLTIYVGFCFLWGSIITRIVFRIGPVSELNR